MRLDEAAILIADDEVDLREIFSGWLGRKGCRVLTAANGAEALKTLDTERIDVLVTDVRMPVMGGVELVRSIYRRRLPIPSIVFVSGFGDVHPREMYGLGVEALIEKPLVRKELLRVLEESLMEREELWQTPPSMPAEQIVELTIESLKEALRDCRFQLGRGGCCFANERPLGEGKTIDLSIHFVSEGLSLKAQGIVRWFEKQTSHAGVSFSYLDPSCRDWVIGTMRDGAYRGFIPQCQCDRPREMQVT